VTVRTGNNTSEQRDAPARLRLAWLLCVALLAVLPFAGGQWAWAQANDSGLPGWDSYSASGGVYGGGVVLRKGENSRNLLLSGRGSLWYRANSVTGSGAEMYTRQYWDTASVGSEAQLNLSGWALDRVRIDASVSQGPLGPRRTDFSVTYDAGPAQVSFGRVRPDMGVNEFVNFRKQLSGISVQGATPDTKVQYSMFASRIKGQVRREAFAGQDSPGPYHLRYTPIVDGSEVVKVDEQRMVRGEDYVIDYYGGWLTFAVDFGGNQQTTMIPATSTISVSYEQAGGEGGSGMIYGLRGTVMAAQGLSVEAAYLTQQSDYGPATSTRSVARREEFIGAGSPGPFQLSYSPIDATKPVLVYVDGALKVEGVDYLFNSASGYIQFTSPIPPGALVVVEYYQSVESGGSLGDKHLLGLTTNWAPQPNTNVSLALAASDSEGGPAGLAMSLQASSAFLDNRLNVRGRYENMEPTFSQIESVGFQQQARGFAVGADYRATDYVTANLDWQRHRTSTGLYFGPMGGGYGTGSTSLSAADFSVLTDQKTISVRAALPKAPEISLSRTMMSNQGAASSSYVSDALRVTHTLGPFSGSLSLNRNKQGYTLLNTTEGSGATSTSVVTTGANAALSYAAGSKARMSLGLSTSSSSGNATQASSRGSTVDASATWNPTPGLALALTHSLSRSRGGYLSSVGGLTGATTVAPGTRVATASGQSQYTNARTGLSANYASPEGRYVVGLDFGFQTYHGGTTAYLADSRSREASLYLHTAFSKTLAANLSLQQQWLHYLSGTGTSLQTRLAWLSLSYNPKRAEQYSLSCQYLHSDSGGGGQTAGTRMLTMELGGQRALAERMRLSSSLQLSRVAGAFDDSRRWTWLTTYSYALSEFLSANAQLRHVRYNSLRQTGYGASDYVANLFSLGLSAGF